MNQEYLNELLESGKLSDELAAPEIGTAELAGGLDVDYSGEVDISSVQVAEDLFMTPDGHLVNSKGEIVA